MCLCGNACNEGAWTFKESLEFQRLASLVFALAFEFESGWIKADYNGWGRKADLQYHWQCVGYTCFARNSPALCQVVNLICNTVIPDQKRFRLLGLGCSLVHWGRECWVVSTHWTGKCVDWELNGCIGGRMRYNWAIIFWVWKWLSKSVELLLWL